MSIKNKESGLYIESSGEFVTEREYIKEWCSEIMENSSIASIEEFDTKYGNDYDLDNDETYDDFIHLFNEQVENQRKNGFTIELNTDDLQKSRISLPREVGKWDFEDCNFEDTSLILHEFDIVYTHTDFDCDFDVNDNYDCEGYLVYLDKNELVIKSEITDNNFTVEEFVDYNHERLNDSHDYEITRKEISDRVLKNVNSITSEYNVYINNVKLEKGEIIAEISDPIHNTKFNVKLDKSNEISIDNISAFEDVIDNAHGISNPNDEELKSIIKSLLKSHAKIDHEALSAKEKIRLDEKKVVKQNNKSRYSI